jgi:A/G-specific adenine glycosylase
LHCLPLFDSEEELMSAVPQRMHAHVQPAAAFTHVLTHKDLHLHPRRLVLPAQAAKDVQWEQGQWAQSNAWPTLGLPAPIRKLLQQDTTH